MHLLAFFWIFQAAYGANILFLNIFASPSHYVWSRALVLGLIEKGHNVTMLTHNYNIEKATVKNFTILSIEGIFEVVYKAVDMKGLTEHNELQMIPMYFDYSQICCVHTFESPALRTLLDYPKTSFDLIVYDTTIGQCLYPLVEIFGNPPVVAVNLMPLTKSRSFGAHIFTSYMPFFATGYEDQMSFGQRLYNFICFHAEAFYHDYIAMPREFELSRKRFGDHILPFDEVEKNVTITLLNVNPDFDYPISLPPNVVPVGGLQIKGAKKLPQDLQKIFDNAEDGVVLVSFGTNIHEDVVGEKTTQEFLDAFGRLNQTVIWKFSTTARVRVPKNVLLRKWLPQGDILGHPKVKVFVSQCGGFSYQEAIYHGVPVVGIPFIVDQYTTSTRLVKRKLAVKLDHRKGELTAEKIFGAIHEVLHNPMYRENMKVASEKHRNQLQTPLERGIFWIEYLLRHGSAENLVPIARSMPGYQLANLDVYLFFGTVLVLIYAVVTWLLVVVKYLLAK